MKSLEGIFTMNSYVCTVCVYIYDPDVGDVGAGVKPKTTFQDLPGGWACPVCGASVDDFLKEA
jgi:rubredoxin